VWGATFDYAADGFVLGGPGHRFADEFEGLERRLYAELLIRLEGESDLQRRAAAYRFPQEFRGIGPLIEKFLDSAFIGVQGAPAPLLRGVYFTSGTQEGSPIDRVLGTLARSFKLERAAGPALAGSGKSFFLKRLLREVIFPESGLAGSDERLERQARRAQMIAFGAIATFTLAIMALWTASFFVNRGFIAAAQAQAAAAKSELEKLGAASAGQEAQLLHALNALRDLPGGFRDRQGGASVTSGYGLSQGDKIGTQAVRAYRNALRDALLPRLAASKDDYSKWGLTDAERADLEGHVRAMRDEAIMGGAPPNPGPAKSP
jgi:type VI secretion system protein ImpL